MPPDRKTWAIAGQTPGTGKLLHPRLSPSSSAPGLRRLNQNPAWGLVMASLPDLSGLVIPENIAAVRLPARSARNGFLPKAPARFPAAARGSCRCRSEMRPAQVSLGWKRLIPLRAAAAGASLEL
jgi:hypothetical protein